VEAISELENNVSGVVASKPNWSGFRSAQIRELETTIIGSPLVKLGKKLGTLLGRKSGLKGVFI
jgi:hypothetical protein